MNKILLLFAHPVYQTSLLNKTLLKGIQNLKNITVHDLYECYPNFMIDVAFEQRLLNEHDVIIFQHPLYWYSCPAILKEWMDLVLEHGYAYGTGGTALKGKIFMSSITAGGDLSKYQAEQNIRDYLQPIESTAKLCNMRFLPPFVTCGGFKLKADKEHQNHNYLDSQVNLYRNLLNKLITAEIEPDQCESFDTMNKFLYQIEGDT